jgi:hypothetical protein
MSSELVLEGNAVEYKHMSLILSEEDSSNIYNKNIINVHIEDNKDNINNKNSIIINFEDDTVLKISSLKLYSIGISIDELKCCKIKYILLPSDSSIFIEIKIEDVDNCIAFMVDRDSFTISYNQTILKLIDDPNGFQKAIPGKFLKYENNNMRFRIYLSNGTHITTKYESNVPLMVPIQELTENHMIGQNVIIKYRGSEWVDNTTALHKVNIAIGDKQILRFYCNPNQIIHQLGG